MNKPFLLFFFLLLVVLSCTRCKEECNDPANPDCPNYVPPTPADPCAGLSATTADFITYQHTWYFVSGDTMVEFQRHCLYNKAITLHAVQDDAEYHWVIGSDHYYTRDVTFQFGQEFIGQTIPLTLTVTRTPNTQCFSDDSGTATKTKYVEPRFFCDASIYGKYYGAWEDNSSDSFVFELIHRPGGASICDRLLVVGAKPHLPDTCFNSDHIFLNNYIEFGQNDVACYAPEGRAFLDSTLNNIMIDYSILVDPPISPREHHIFRGYRIN